MKLVVVESPYAGRTGRNVAYLHAAMADCLDRGEAPYASHALYTQPGVLNDNIPEERRHGIDAGLAWGAKADLVAVYTDLGVTLGMRVGVEAAKAEGRPVEYRTLSSWSEDGMTAPDAALPGVPNYTQIRALTRLARHHAVRTPTDYDAGYYAGLVSALDWTTGGPAPVLPGAATEGATQ